MLHQLKRRANIAHRDVRGVFWRLWLAAPTGEAITQLQLFKYMLHGLLGDVISVIEEPLEC
jgi:hypothetical protein